MRRRLPARPCVHAIASLIASLLGARTQTQRWVVPDGRPLSAAADVFGVDALPNLLSFMRARYRELCSCVMCTVVNVIQYRHARSKKRRFGIHFKTIGYAIRPVTDTK
jgi:hypothetical protein